MYWPYSLNSPTSVYFFYDSMSEKYDNPKVFPEKSRTRVHGHISDSSVPFERTASITEALHHITVFHVSCGSPCLFFLSHCWILAVARAGKYSAILPLLFDPEACFVLYWQVYEEQMHQLNQIKPNQIIVEVFWKIKPDRRKYCWHCTTQTNGEKGMNNKGWIWMNSLKKYHVSFLSTGCREAVPHCGSDLFKRSDWTVKSMLS